MSLPFPRTSEISANQFLPGLQTPRLKRLAEIVSAQAIAQQERLEFEPDGDETNGNGYHDDGEYDGDDGYAAGPQQNGHDEYPEEGQGLGIQHTPRGITA